MPGSSFKATQSSSSLHHYLRYLYNLYQRWHFSWAKCSRPRCHLICRRNLCSLCKITRRHFRPSHSTSPLPLSVWVLSLFHPTLCISCFVLQVQLFVLGCSLFKRLVELVARQTTVPQFSFIDCSGQKRIQDRYQILYIMTCSTFGDGDAATMIN